MVIVAAGIMAGDVSGCVSRQILSVPRLGPV
jgi:hypothetical protein